MCCTPTPILIPLFQGVGARIKVGACYELGTDQGRTEVLYVWRGLGFSLCAAPPDVYCPQISGKRQTKVRGTINVVFPTEEHTWGSERISWWNVRSRVGCGGGGSGRTWMGGWEVISRSGVVDKGCRWESRVSTYESWSRLVRNSFCNE